MLRPCKGDFCYLCSSLSSQVQILNNFFRKNYSYALWYFSFLLFFGRYVSENYLESLMIFIQLSPKFGGVYILNSCMEKRFKAV